MELDAQDWRASSLFELQRPDKREIVGGIVFTAIVVVTFPALAILSALLLGGLHSWFGSSANALPPPPVDVIETRFVRLGKKRNPRQLPSKEVPVEQAAPVPTAAQESTPVPTAPAPKPTKERGIQKSKERPDEDLLSQLGESAGEISEMSKGPELEGDPDGIVEGTKSEGDEEDIYLGKLYSYFRRGWQTPTSISDEELKKLQCDIELSVTDDGRIGGFEISRSSGNAAFDDSVLLRIAQVEDAKLPEPPESVAPRVLGKTISLRFFGRHAR